MKALAKQDVAAAVDAALEAPTLPEKEGRARLHALISSLRTHGTGEIELDLSRVRTINGGQLRKLLVSLRRLLCGREPKLRPVALRVLRYLCHTDEAIVLMREEFLDMFVARSLEREAAHMQERAAALRVFDHLAALQPKSVTASLVAAVVAVAEHASDPLRNVRLRHRMCTPYALHVRRALLAHCSRTAFSPVPTSACSMCTAAHLHLASIACTPELLRLPSHRPRCNAHAEYTLQARPARAGLPELATHAGRARCLSGGGTQRAAHAVACRGAGGRGWAGH